MAQASLDYTLNKAFSNTISYPRPNRVVVSDEYRYIEIPVESNRFEIPSFALDALSKLLLYQDKSSIAAELHFSGYTPSYKTAGRYFQDIINASLDSTFYLSEGENHYYAAKGIIMDEHFVPILLCSWMVEKVFSDTQLVGFKIIKPILRVAPQCYLSQDDAIQKLIVKKIIPTILTTHLSIPSAFPIETIRPVAKVIIDDIPFHTRTVVPPTVNTTNEELLSVALYHLDEMCL